MNFRVFTAVVLLVSICRGFACAGEVDSEVLSTLREYCGDCHFSGESEGKVNLEELVPIDFSNSNHLTSWHKVLKAINSGAMPPETERQLSAAGQQLVRNFLSDAIDRQIQEQRNQSGKSSLRRLNRFEYQNTMYDLLGLDMDYARDLPPDPVSADGFRNDQHSLQMSALELGYFLQTARRALKQVIVEGPPPRQFHYKFDKSNVDKWLGNPQQSNTLGRQQMFLAKMVDDYPEQGEFIVTVSAEADLKSQTGLPILEASVGYRPDTKVLMREAGSIEIDSTERREYHFRGRLENHPLPVRGQGKFPGLVVRLRNTYDDGSRLPKKQNSKDKKKSSFPPEPHLPVIQIKSVEFVAPVYSQWPTKLYRRILFQSPLLETDESSYVEKVLRRFMERAYRRPATDAEVKNSLDFFHEIRPSYASFESAIRETLAMVLVRPEFLYLIVERSDAPGQQLGPFELAARLSYFLWSTMPDQRLLDLAESGKLSEPSILAEEFDRMLDSPLSQRFTDQFTTQWLGLDIVQRVAVDKRKYPKFDDHLKRDMQCETQSYFREILLNNSSAALLLESDFSMLNEKLAKHYSIQGVFGEKFRPVTLPADSIRGGLLTHSSVLLANSTGSESHVIRRGVWIRDRILNDPPAPPPPNVPSLEEAGASFRDLPISEQLTIHRKDPECAACHRDLDPWGLALERFDALGLAKPDPPESNPSEPDVGPGLENVRLPGGQAIDSIHSLRNHLLTVRRDDFARSLVRRLLTYALGRELDLEDESTINELCESFHQNDYQLRDLLKAVVISNLFVTK